MQNNWHISQQVVALRSVSFAGLIEGRIYQIHGIKAACCKSWVFIDVGIRLPSNNAELRCVKCGCDHASFSGNYIFPEYYFAPLTEVEAMEEAAKELMSITEIIT